MVHGNTDALLYSCCVGRHIMTSLLAQSLCGHMWWIPVTCCDTHHCEGSLRGSNGRMISLSQAMVHLLRWVIAKILLLQTVSTHTPLLCPNTCRNRCKTCHAVIVELCCHHCIRSRRRRRFMSSELVPVASQECSPWLA